MPTLAELLAKSDRDDNIWVVLVEHAASPEFHAAVVIDCSEAPPRVVGTSGWIEGEVINLQDAAQKVLASNLTLDEWTEEGEYATRMLFEGKALTAVKYIPEES